MEALLRDLAAKIKTGRWNRSRLGLIGVRTRGLPIAERLAALLHVETGQEIPVGAVDTTLYRDYLENADRWPVLRGTDIPFDVEDAEIVLVDDVLNTYSSLVSTCCSGSSS